MVAVGKKATIILLEAIQNNMGVNDNENGFYFV